MPDAVKLKVPLSTLIDAYAKTRNFQRVSDIYRIHRPDIRRAMSRASKQLMAADRMTDPVNTTVSTEESALGAYIYGLIDKADASRQGYSKRKRAKICNIYRKDSMVLNQFTFDAADIEHVLIARANH